MGEPNYIQISIAFENENFSVKDIDAFKNDVLKAISFASDLENNWYERKLTEREA